MNIAKSINNPLDPLFRPYYNLKDKQLRRDYGIFIAEGEHLVRRLIESSFQVDSVLMLETRFNTLTWTIPSDVPIYLSDTTTISQIVGFPFHRGVLAAGMRPKPITLPEMLPELESKRWIICPEINNVENLGSLIRTGAALGYENVLLGPSCCDPFSRRALRTAMGATFSINLVQSNDLRSDLLLLKSNQYELHGAVLDSSAIALETVDIPERFGLMFGTEAHGLAPQWQELCDQHVTIPMYHGDSLNISVAAGILLYHYAHYKHPDSA